MKTLVQSVLGLSAAALLAACGGGNDTPAGGSGFPATAKYAGTWTAPCAQEGNVTIGGATSFANAKASHIIPVASSATAVNSTFEIKIYQPADTNCTGPVHSTVTYPVSITLDAVGTGVSGSDKLTVSSATGSLNGNVINTSGVTTITSGGVTTTYGTSFFIAVAARKEISLATATTLTFGDGTETATTYPTGLETAADSIFAKQP